MLCWVDDNDDDDDDASYTGHPEGLHRRRGPTSSHSLTSLTTCIVVECQTSKASFAMAGTFGWITLLGSIQCYFLWLRNAILVKHSR